MNWKDKVILIGSTPGKARLFWGSCATFFWFLGLGVLGQEKQELAAAFMIFSVAALAITLHLVGWSPHYEEQEPPPKLTFSERARRKLWGQESQSSPEPPTGYNYAAYRKVSDPHYVPPREPEEQINRPGFVYIVQSGQHYKIGITQGDVSRRVAQLQTGSPQKIHIVHIIETDCPIDLERDLHRMLAHKRGEGEWFRLSEEELRIIKRLK